MLILFQLLSVHQYCDSCVSVHVYPGLAYLAQMTRFCDTYVLATANFSYQFLSFEGVKHTEVTRSPS